MKRLLIALPLLLSGCLMPNYTRLVPENKSAHIKIYNPIYGYIEIDTRVVNDTNNPPLYVLPAPVGTSVTQP